MVSHFKRSSDCIKRWAIFRFTSTWLDVKKWLKHLLASYNKINYVSNNGANENSDDNGKNLNDKNDDVNYKNGDG